MLRQKQKELRCQAVLDAAEQLIRETGSAGFSMLKLAERAQMSSMTPYNLFGTKGAILYALLNRSLDDIFTGGEPAMTHPDPFEQALLAATAAVDFFIADPEYYRPLYQFLLGVSEPVYRPAYMARALEFWRRAFTGLQARGHLGEPRLQRRAGAGFCRSLRRDAGSLGSSGDRAR